MTRAEPDWWNNRAVFVLLVMLSIVPLLWPPVPPLTDLPGHMGRYAVQLDPNSPILSQWYVFRWQLIGNLGVDLLVVPMSQMFGLELAVKLIVMTIPAMTVAGFLWLSAEVHGRVSPVALFALPLAYNHPFHFGFVNFALGMALTLNATALWLHMRRRRSGIVTGLVFIPVAAIVWLTHTYAWGVLGILCFSIEFARHRSEEMGIARSFRQACTACLPMALPLIAMLLWQADTNSRTTDWFNWSTKSQYFMQIFRDRWEVFDVLSLFVVLAVIVYALASRSLAFAKNLGLAGALLLIAFLLLPRMIFGSAYADMRLMPFVLAIALLAIAPAVSNRRAMRVVAMLGLAFFVTRIGGTTASLALYSQRWDSALAALPSVPVGSRVVSFGRWSCLVEWQSDRTEHLAAMAIVRRASFSNDQWQVPGANLLTVIKRDARGFVADPSQMVTPRPCRKREWRTMGQALASFPRAAFDYVWLFDPPAYDARLTRGMTLVWARGSDRLYRIDRP